jgi:uncharacterized protein involved in exopolysaccharide biosynthesis
LLHGGLSTAELYRVSDRGRQLSKRDIIVFLFKWKYSLIGYFLFVVATVTTFVYLLPQKYEATASVLIESNRAPVMRSDMAPGVEELSVLNSEASIILSKTVLSSAVDEVGIAESGEPPTTIEQLIDALGAWLEDVGLSEPMTPREELIRKLEKDLGVAPLPNSNVIAITFSGKDPKRTAQIVNAVTNNYIQHHLKIFSSAGTSQVYRLQVERLGRELDRRRKELADYKRTTSVSALDDTMHSLVQLQGSLTSDLEKARLDLAELRTRFGPGHTKVSVAAAKVESIKRTLTETQGKLQKLELQQEKVQQLELGSASSEKSYQEYQKRYEEERLNDLANPDVVNVRVIEYATMPTRADHSRLFYIALAVAGGFILSLAIAFVREYFDHRVSDPDTVAQLLGAPTLGSVERVGRF